MDGPRCTKCGGLLVRETYQCEEGKCVYIKCVMCSTCTFFDKTETEEEEVEAAYLSDHPSFSEIAREMGITKQRVGFLYLRALKKVAKLYPNLWRLR